MDYVYNLLGLDNPETTKKSSTRGSSAESSRSSLESSRSSAESSRSSPKVDPRVLIVKIIENLKLYKWVSFKLKDSLYLLKSNNNALNIEEVSTNLNSMKDHNYEGWNPDYEGWVISQLQYDTLLEHSFEITEHYDFSKVKEISPLLNDKDMFLDLSKQLDTIMKK